MSNNQEPELPKSVVPWWQDGKTIIKKHIEGPQGVRGRNSENSLIEKELGWAPTNSLKWGLEKTYPWIKKQIKITKI